MTDNRHWTVRPAEPADRAFLASLFRSTRPELAMLPAGLAEQIIEQQQRLQDAGYRAAFPHARELIIECRGESMGRLLIDEQARLVTIVDLALSPERRGQGLGSAVLRHLQAGGKDLALHVAHDNTVARHLYLKFGFVEESRDAVRAAMRWRAAQ